MICNYVYIKLIGVSNKTGDYRYTKLNWNCAEQLEDEFNMTLAYGVSLANVKNAKGYMITLNDMIICKLERTLSDNVLSFDFRATRRHFISKM